VIQTAARLADESGLEALSLANLAAELGVRTPSLYNHVAGLPGLYRELALHGTRELATRFTTAAVGKAGAAAIQAVAEAYRGFIKEHPGVYAATVRSISTIQPHDQELQAASQASVNVVVTILSAYGLSDEDALHAVRGLRSVVHGFATLEVNNGFGLPLNIDASFQRLLEIFTAGLEHRPGP
jgi:AcrR family transcriptional regulator